MIDRLDRLVDDIAGLNNRLIVLVGPPRSGKSDLLRQLAARRNARILNLSLALGRELLTVQSSRRHLHVADLLKDLADGFSNEGFLLMDNIELLFDQTLHLNPLDLMKRHAHAHRVIAVWPGQLREDRLSYASTGHPEHRDYGIEGLVAFNTH